MSPGLSPELGQMASLERLVLNYNDLSGPIPEELGSLSRPSNVREMKLGKNQFTGSVPLGSSPRCRKAN